MQRYFRICFANVLGCLCCFFLVLHPSIGRTQPLSLYEAVNRSLTNYPAIRQREAEVAASGAHIKTVTGYRLPSLILHDEATLGTANSVEGSYFSMGIVPSASGSIQKSENTTLGSGNIALSLLQWEFYNFGYYKAVKQEAQAQLATANAGLASAKYLLTNDVVSLYLDWLKKYRLMKIEQENLGRSETILKAIKATVLSGLKPGVDSATASATYADAVIAYLQAQDNYTADKISLASYTSLDTTSIVPDTAAIRNAFGNNQVLQLEPNDSVPQSNPLLDVYQKQYAQQLAGNNSLAKRFLPRMNLLGAAWSRSSSISPSEGYSANLADGLNNSRYNYLFGLAITYNITDLKHRHDLMQEGKYQAESAQHALEDQQLNLNKMLQQANAAYVSTMAKLRELPAQLQAAKQAYGQQLALYKNGLNTLIDVTNAQYVLRQTETNYVLAQDELLQLLYIRASLSNQSDIFLDNFKQ